MNDQRKGNGIGAYHFSIILLLILAICCVPGVHAVSDTTIIGFRWDSTKPSPQLSQIDSTGATIAKKDTTFWNNWAVTGNMKTVVVTPSNEVLYGTNNRGDGLDLTGASGDVMVEIPRFYTRSTYANGIFSYWISPLPAYGFAVAPMFNQRGTGSEAGTPAQYWYVGRYDASLNGNKLQSATGKAPAVSMTIGTARTYAENKGQGWGITNIWTLSGLRQLFYTEMLTLDSQTAWTKSRGIVNDYGINSGADSIDTQISANSATGSGTGENGKTPVSYRGIENLWGNVYQFQDGFNAIQGTTNVISPTGLGTTGQKTIFKDVLDATDVQSVGALPLEDGYQKNLMNTDVARPLFLPSAVGGSDSTYLSDYYWYPRITNPGTPNILFSGGVWASAGTAGVGRLIADHGASYSDADVGARVEFRRSTAPGEPKATTDSGNIVAPGAPNFFGTTGLAVIGLLVILAGGGYAFYRMKKKPSGGEPPATAPSSGAGDLTNRIAAVDQNASTLSQFKRPVQTLLTKAREQYQSGAYDAARATLKTAENAIPSLTQCETRLMQWKKEGYVTTSLESLNTDNPTTITTAFRDFEQNLETLKQYARRVQELKREGDANPAISQRIASIDAQLHDPRNIPGIEQEIKAIEQEIQEQQETARHQKETGELLAHLQSKAEKLTRYKSLTDGSFTEAQAQIADGKYDEARKTLRRTEDPVDKLLECETSFAAWKAQGYTTTELEGLHPRNPDEVIAVFQKYGQNINRLETIAQELASTRHDYPELLEQTETAGIVQAIEEGIKDPARIETVERDYRRITDTARQIGAARKKTEQDLADQAKRVEENSGSATVKREIDPISRDIRQHNTTRAQEEFKALALRQRAAVDDTLIALQKDGARISFPADHIQQAIDRGNYGDAILDAENAVAELERTRDIYTQAQELKPSITEPSIIALFEKGKYEEFIRAGSAWLDNEKVRVDSEQHLALVENAITQLRQDGAVVTLSTEPIRKQISAREYTSAVTSSQNAKQELAQSRKTYLHAKELRPSITEPSLIALYTKGDYGEFIRAGKKWQERQTVLNAKKERAAQLLDTAQKIGQIPGEITEKLSSVNENEIDGAIASLESFIASAKPELSLALDHTRLVADKWHKVGVKITNLGNAHATGITLAFSEEFETRWLSTIEVRAQESTTLEIGIKPKTDGNIPIEITATYKDNRGNDYRQAFRFWIDVVDRMNITPGTVTPANVTPSPQAPAPVFPFTPKPQTPKQLPQELSDRYTESAFIGKGGFARVFKAKRKDGKLVAVKIPISLDASTGKSFIAEMQNWTKLDHSNIVRVFDYNIMPMPYFEMELCDGSLAELKKPIDPEETAWILFNVCEGLKYTHKRLIVHRDLKPQNILVKNGIPKISDWGLSKVISDSTSTTAMSFTPYYAAPEQMNNRPKDERTDIWQLGVILYELSTGELPFKGESVIEIAVAISTKDPMRPSGINPAAGLVEPIIIKCLEKDPNKRYPSVLELQKALALVLRKNYTDQLAMSVSAHDFNKSAFYCGDLVMVNLLTGDITTAYKYVTDLATYAKDEVKDEVQELADQIKMRIEEGITDVPDELIKKAEIIVHKVSRGFRRM